MGEMTWDLLGDEGMRDEECANLLSQRMKTAANEETAQDKTKPTSQKTPAEVEFTPPPRKIISVAVALICGS